ncbi:hypothetical protein FRC07_002741 [Ceratobasidium sp. 392]|nr:hypothetical protein FRC07_002741 [Ceratobasidium sp. 392]
MDQIPQYPNTDTGFQEYTQQFESYANPTSSFSSNFYVAQAQAHTDVHSSQFQPQSYDPYHQPTPRISRVFSEPTFPANDIQSHSYTASSIPQRHRAFSTGANPYNFGTPTSVAGQSSTPFNDGQGISRLYAYELPRTGQDIIYSESGDLEETKWPVEISMPDQYLAQQTQEQPYFDVFRPEAFLPEELGQTSYEVQGGHEAVYRTAGRSGQMSVEDSLRSYNTPDLVDLNPETSYMHPEMSSYMRYPGANTYVNYPAVDIPREVRFSAQQSQAGAPYPNSALNLQSHTDSYTLSYPQPQVPLRQSVEPQPNSPSNRSIPTPPTGSQLFQSNRPITPVYVDVGVQTDPWQPTTRLATKEAGHKLGGTQTIMKGGKAKRILPAARSSNQSQPVPKDTPQAKNKLALAQLKVQPQTPPESRLPHASSGSHRLSAASTSEVLSLEGYQRPQSIGSSHRMVPHDSKRLSQSHTGSSQVPDSSLLVMNDHAPTSSIPPAPPGVAITASSNSLARPVQQVQALPSPCTPDLATHQTFDGFVASTRTSTPLITDMLPRVSRPDHSSHEASFASTHRISGAHLPTPDPSPAGGMNWQLYFPSGPQFEQEPGRVTAAPAPVYEYHQASDKPRVDDSTVRQGNNQPHQAGFHVAVPFIRVHDAEGMLAGPGGLLGQDYTQPGTSVDAAPHRSPQNHFEYRATQPEVSEFSESSVQERNNLVDRPPTLQSQHDPTWQRYQSVRKMESYVEGKQQSTPIVSQLDIPRLHQTHPELVARGQQPQAQISILKRERSASET